MISLFFKNIVEMVSQHSQKPLQEEELYNKKINQLEYPPLLEHSLNQRKLKTNS
jgi:hypothetical protein